MKKLMVILAIGISSASAQTMYKLESVPIYDSLGNQYMIRSVYDHLPTTKDSADFLKESNDYVFTTLRSLKKQEETKLYTVKVAQVRYDKNGNAQIKPTEKFRSEWYKCSDKSVKVGDSILITRKDAVE